MLLKDVQVGQSCEVERVTLPAQMKRHLEALGMTDHAPVSVLNRKGKGLSLSNCGAAASRWVITLRKILK